MTLPDALRALAVGASLGLRFNPLASAAAAVLGAGLLGSRKPGRGRAALGEMTIMFAWLLGDGLRVLARTRDLVDVQALSPDSIITSLTWVFTALVVGYILPVLVGIAVGRRVTLGTGWLAAAMIATTVSVTSATIVSTLAG